MKKQTNKQIKSETMKTKFVPNIKSQLLRGRVISAKLPKTVTVLVESIKTHPLYQKTYKRSKKYLANDEVGVSLGDIVELVKIRPISKNKHFKIERVVGKNIAAVVTEQLKEQTEKVIAEIMPEKKEEVISDEEKVMSQKKEKKETKKIRKEKLVTRP
ncbi:30S ribosomal protein S17 [Candidatus Daviesbacteria bacterium RIFOXYD1_FULL_41_10]|uniref:Small ribosomal subunit protein uS17 n=2 Tax=Candidatus Daviesiibacteriota TaxID=1752718 RepID=A0A1F5MYY8_9BACT|nr:MAG: 30S ribosomal protein S17 [Candidatus Daviesbacteria bacterium GW2011_GWB1_41_5]OGE70599.1 MAG: 30S ribosomal protein S17 [Candidatus Daviesbacteria bacterium RIFOXYD1_FULL_41_10]